MSALLPPYSSRPDGRAVPSITVWLACSIALHLAILLWAQRPHLPPREQPAIPPLTVELRPQLPLELPAEPPATPPPAAAPAPPPKLRAPRQPPQPTAKPQPPLVAANKPRTEEPPFTVPAPTVEETPAQSVPPVPPATPPLTPVPPQTDLAAYIEARRRARGEVPDASAADAERNNRGMLNNPVLKQPVPTNFALEKPRNGYGSFEIRRRGVDYAEFMFKGWNENFRRDGLELIEVRQGNHGNIDIAVIRSIIGIIRRTESGDFTWVSRRLGRSLTLSARARDNAGLEEFMLQEFYDDLHRYR